MNVEHLLKKFHLLGDAPDIVVRLRKLVVTLAVGGSQSEAEREMTASLSILKQIEEEKQRLIQIGKLGRQKPFPPISPEELPAGFTDTGLFARLGSIASIEKGPTGIQGAEPGRYPLVVTAEARSSCDHFDFEGPAAIVPLVSSTGHGKATLHRLHYQEGKFALGGILAAVLPFAPGLVSARFLFEYLTAFKEELLVSRMTGTANVSLNVGKISEVPVPIVPLEIQRRVDELMKLCDQLEVAREKREAKRDRLTAASLARLSRPDPDPRAFRDHVAFALDNLAALAARPDQVKALRQTILNLAVRGKLVSQDPSDEPALKLLDRLQKDIQGYAKSNDIKEPVFTSLDKAEQPFPLPIHWSWARLGMLCRVVTDGDHQPPPKAENGVAFLTIGNVTTGYINFSNCRFVPEQYFKSLPIYKIPRYGDIIYTVVGATLGRPVLVDTQRDFCVQRHIAILKPAEGLCVPFLKTTLSSLFVYEQATASATGIAQPTVALKPLRDFLIPLPPLAEQQRIVAKVDELMQLCDRLDASLTDTAATRRRLLDAILHAALAPAEETSPAAVA